MSLRSVVTREYIGKPIRCKAAICRKSGEALVIEEIEVDPPKAWEVRIKILCTSLCHSDVTFWKMDSSAPAAKFPRILGHEAAGVVESVGEYVEEVKEGDVVVPVFLANCGECRDCESTKSNNCSKFGNQFAFDMPRDGTSRFRDMKGEELNHLLRVSSFSEYTVVDITHVVKISHDLPLHIACLLSCGVSTGKRFGITDFVNPSTCNDKSVSEVIKDMTNGGADYCFECIGLASLMAEAFNSSREGWGKTVILGVEMHGSPVTLSPYQILRGRTICGSFFGGLKPKSDIPLLAQKYLDNELSLDGFITQEVDFKDINKAFDYLLQGKSLRCIIRMDNISV